MLHDLLKSNMSMTASVYSPASDALHMNMSSFSQSLPAGFHHHQQQQQQQSSGMIPSSSVSSSSGLPGGSFNHYAHAQYSAGMGLPQAQAQAHGTPGTILSRQQQQQQVALSSAAPSPYGVIGSGILTGNPLALALASHSSNPNPNPNRANSVPQPQSTPAAFSAAAAHRIVLDDQALPSLTALGVLPETVQQLIEMQEYLFKHVSNDSFCCSIFVVMFLPFLVCHYFSLAYRCALDFYRLTATITTVPRAAVAQWAVRLLPWRRPWQPKVKLARWIFALQFHLHMSVS
jgi:hypothetical protein